MAASRNPQKAGYYELSSGEPPSHDRTDSGVWYYEQHGAIEFHLDVFNGTEYRGHVRFRVQRSKLLKSLKRIEPHV